MDESIKLDIRPLEVNNLFTIRHVNSIVTSYCMMDPDAENTGKGKLVIVLDIDAGVFTIPISTEATIQHAKENEKTEIETLAKKKARQAKEAKILHRKKATFKGLVMPEDGVKLPLIYNDNKIKHNANAAAELTLKFVIPDENVLYLNQIENRQTVTIQKISKQEIKANNDPSSGYSNFAARDLGTKSPTTSGTGGSIDEGMSIKSPTNPGLGGAIDPSGTKSPTDHTSAIVIGG